MIKVLSFFKGRGTFPRPLKLPFCGCKDRGFTLIELMVVIAIAGILMAGVVKEMGQTFKMQKNSDYLHFTRAIVHASILAKDPTANYGISFNNAYLARTSLLPERYINRTGVPSIVVPLGILSVSVARWGPALSPLGFQIIYTGMNNKECSLLINTLGSSSFDWIYSNGIIVKNGTTGTWLRGAGCDRITDTNSITMYKEFK